MFPSIQETGRYIQPHWSNQLVLVLGASRSLFPQIILLRVVVSFSTFLWLFGNQKT